MAAAVANATDDGLEARLTRSERIAPAERRVAERLIELGPEGALLSAAALAAQLGTSDATVVRTAKALGYGGLADLRRAMATQGADPPLRERLSDVPALVDHLLRSIASHLAMRAKTIAPDAIALLAAYDWRRNNVRELRNCLERMVIASDAAVIGAADVPPEIRGGDDRDEASDVTAPPGTLKAQKAQAERQIVLAALDRNEWHITRTADALGLADHSSLLKIMRRHGLSKGMHRDA